MDERRIAELCQELQDLEEAIIREPPLSSHTMAIAKTKIAKLRQLLAEIRQKLGDGLAGSGV